MIKIKVAQVSHFFNTFQLPKNGMAPSDPLGAEILYHISLQFVKRKCAQK